MKEDQVRNTDPLPPALLMFITNARQVPHTRLTLHSTYSKNSLTREPTAFIPISPAPDPAPSRAPKHAKRTNYRLPVLGSWIGHYTHVLYHIELQVKIFVGLWHGLRARGWEGCRTGRRLRQRSYVTQRLLLQNLNYSRIL